MAEVKFQDNREDILKQLIELRKEGVYIVTDDCENYSSNGSGIRRRNAPTVVITPTTTEEEIRVQLAQARKELHAAKKRIEWLKQAPIFFEYLKNNLEYTKWDT
jgi:hypothetical protein